MKLPMKYERHRGFTLIELLIVIAVVALLAAVAYPSYTSAMLKGKRAEARTALTDLLQQEERYMTQRNCYLGFATDANGMATANAPSPPKACGGVRASTVPFKTFSASSLATSSYLLSAGTCPDSSGGSLSIADCVQVIATPIKPDVEAGSLRMTSTGDKDCTGTNLSVCWK